MRTVAPDYYSAFRCIADKCKHSCCVGWEIDIDEDSLLRYQDPKHPLHEELDKHIDCTDTPHFRLDENERCPFLTGEGLCRIILTTGEESLCQICADHPRFRNYFSHQVEIGLGLCCEAVVTLLLGREEPVTLVAPYEDGALGDDGALDEPTPEEADFLALREEIFSVLQNRELPMQARLDEMLTLCGCTLQETTVGAWARELQKLEQMDPAWGTCLDRLVDSTRAIDLPSQRTAWDIPLEQLAVYFVFRHLADSLDDGRLAERAGFCVRSVQVLAALFSLEPSWDEACDLVRLYSSEIEYSEENIETILNLIHNNQLEDL